MPRFRLSKLLNNVIISEGGVVPYIHPEVGFIGSSWTDRSSSPQLLPAKSKKHSLQSQEV